MVRDEILYFFGKILLFFKMGRKLLFFERFKNSDFVPILKNSKKISKNIKFHLHAYFIINIMLNGSDRRFGL